LHRLLDSFIGLGSSAQSMCLSLGPDPAFEARVDLAFAHQAGGTAGNEDIVKAYLIDSGCLDVDTLGRDEDMTSFQRDVKWM
jgi:hypothetical protein